MTEEGKKIGIDEIIKQKNTKNIIPIISETVMVKQCYYQNGQYVIVKNQDLLKNKRQVEY